MSLDIWWGLKTNSLNAWNYQKTNRDHVYGSAFIICKMLQSRAGSFSLRWIFILTLKGESGVKKAGRDESIICQVLSKCGSCLISTVFNRNSYSMIYQTQEVHFLVYTFQKDPGLGARMKKTAQTDLPGCSLYSCSINTYWVFASQLSDKWGQQCNTANFSPDGWPWPCPFNPLHFHFFMCKNGDSKMVFQVCCEESLRTRHKVGT